MKLYEINEEIQHLADAIEIDPETGEFSGDADELLSQIETLQMEKKSVLTYLAKIIMNLRAESSALKGEYMRLKARRDQLAKKEDRLMSVLDRECGGEKTDLGIATFSYRKTSHLDINNAEEAVQWLKDNDHSDCYRVPDPQISKSEVKKLINSGVAVPGCSVVTDYSCSLK